MAKHTKRRRVRKSRKTGRRRGARIHRGGALVSELSGPNGKIAKLPDDQKTFSVLKILLHNAIRTRLNAKLYHISIGGTINEPEMIWTRLDAGIAATLNSATLNVKRAASWAWNKGNTTENVQLLSNADRVAKTVATIYNGDVGEWYKTQVNADTTLMSNIPKTVTFKTNEFSMLLNNKTVTYKVEPTIQPTLFVENIFKVYADMED